MQRERAKAKPSVISGVEETYKSVTELAEHLQNHPEDLTIISKDGTVKQLQFKLVKSKGNHLILYDPEMIHNFNEHTVQVDGTFDAVPKVKKVTQLVTLMSKKYNVVSNEIM